MRCSIPVQTACSGVEIRSKTTGSGPSEKTVPTISMSLSIDLPVEEQQHSPQPDEVPTAFDSRKALPTASAQAENLGLRIPQPQLHNTGAPPRLVAPSAAETNEAEADLMTPALAGGLPGTAQALNGTASGPDLAVGDIEHGHQDDEVQMVFERYVGPIAQCTLIEDACSITFMNADHAQAAVDRYDGGVLEVRTDKSVPGEALILYPKDSNFRRTVEDRIGPLQQCHLRRGEGWMTLFRGSITKQLKRLQQHHRLWVRCLDPWRAWCLVGQWFSEIRGSTGSRSAVAPAWLTAVATAFAVFLFVSPARAESKWGRRIFSVGDLHGDYQSSMMTIFRTLGLADAEGAWVGQSAVLVQTGDLLDRGEESGPLVRELFRLQDEAPKSGGKVILLLGNHELMNLQNDLRYASAAETRSLSTSGTSTPQVRSEMLSQDGWLGRGLRDRLQALVLLGPEEGLEKPVLFVHAGLLPSFGSDVKSLNSEVKSLLEHPAAELQTNPSPLLSDDGPFWTRRLALGPEGQVCGEVQKTLEALGAQRMVLGHTAQADGRVHERCGGQVILGDTLISRFYTGTAHPSAVEFFPDGSAVAIDVKRGARTALKTP
ncbi:Uncharacterized protein C1840.07c [Durusdinium trenchii]|uniref:Uncharacterized protein C1840.07c n=1 Tax=Durusdinium trenchii TaxID=1381693 RepID=A0ABP0QCT1_9DINO